jgi:hypothetical protein
MALGRKHSSSRTHNRMNSLQRLSHVLRTAAFLLVQLHALWVRFCRTDESIANEGGGQAFEEFLVRLGEAVVDFIAGCPERVAACLGELCQAQGRVICWDGLKLDVGMPLRGIVASIACLAGALLVAEDLLPGEGADGADFRVVHAKLGGVVEDGMDVE